jgi:ribose transport system substrate-binding protein
LSPGKTIAYVSCGSFNSICVEIGHDLTTIGKSIGWHVKIFNGQGTTSGWLSAFDDAVALHPAGIILGAITPSSVPAPMAKARSLGIPVVGALAASYPGPNQMGLFYNASEAPAAIGKLEADWAIAESNGTARVILMYDDTYAIARAKNAEYVATLRECKTCTILKDVETPFADLGTNGSSLVDSWLSKWGTKPIYLISVGDVAFPDLIPTLEARHVPKNMFLGIGADGEPSAYQYIRGGNYQVATVPQPDQELSYECLDELNRAFHHQPAAVFNPPPYLVTKADINIQGGAKNEYDPANGYAAHYMKIWGIR